MSWIALGYQIYNIKTIIITISKPFLSSYNNIVLIFSLIRAAFLSKYNHIILILSLLRTFFFVFYSFYFSTYKIVDSEYSTVVFITAQVHSTKPELRSCAGSNPTHEVSEICDDENFWQWSRPKIRLNAIRQSTIPRKQFIIIFVRIDIKLNKCVKKLF